MLSYSRGPRGLHPPAASGNAAGALLSYLTSPWYKLIASLHDTVLSGTVAYASSRGLMNLYLPLTTRTITCPSGLGSDSRPVPVTVSGVETYLADSMQFMLEYGCRMAPSGCYTIMPSFRADDPDESHLSQFVHSEAEFPGTLEDLIGYVEGYIKSLAGLILERHQQEIGAAVGTLDHLERAAKRDGGFERITFAQAARMLADDSALVRAEGGGRTLTRRGEQALMHKVGEFLWVTHFDHLASPFYQAFSNGDCRTAANADLFFGIGEVVGAGERHVGGEEVRKALAMHGVTDNEYAWYVRMKYELPMRTSGFGMGVERFLMWVLQHADIRELPLVSRVAESPTWPDRVDRP